MENRWPFLKPFHNSHQHTVHTTKPLPKTEAKKGGLNTQSFNLRYFIYIDG